jgi:hypothetical protein
MKNPIAFTKLIKRISKNAEPSKKALLTFNSQNAYPNKTNIYESNVVTNGTNQSINSSINQSLNS